MHTTLSEPEFVAMPDVPDDYELVHGELVECPPMSAYAGLVAHRIAAAFRRDNAARSMGDIYTEMHFLLPTDDDPTKVRRPDLAFVSYEKFPFDKPIPFAGNPLPVVPDIVIEVLSPNDNDSNIRFKRSEYLQAGVSSVWTVYPDSREIYCYVPGSRTPRVFGDGDILTDSVIPDFKMKIDGLFPPVDNGM